MKTFKILIAIVLIVFGTITMIEMSIEESGRGLNGAITAYAILMIISILLLYSAYKEQFDTIMFSNNAQEQTLQKNINVIFENQKEEGLNTSKQVGIQYNMQVMEDSLYELKKLGIINDSEFEEKMKIINKQNFASNLKNKNLPSVSILEYSYYIIEDDEQSAPLTITELKNKYITEDTYIWRKGLSDWTKASNIDELKNIIIYKPPPFNPNIKSNVHKEDENKSTTENYIISNKSYRLQDIKNEFENGNYFINKKTIISVSNGSQKLLSEIPELSFLLGYFPPDINSTL